MKQGLCSLSQASLSGLGGSINSPLPSEVLSFPFLNDLRLCDSFWSDPYTLLKQDNRYFNTLIQFYFHYIRLMLSNLYQFKKHVFL